MSATPGSDKENIASTQQAQPAVRVGQDAMMSLLESLCEPTNLTRTKSGNGFLVAKQAAMKLHQAKATKKFLERNEKHTKALPFNSEVMENFIDLANCTYAEVEPSSALGEALLGDHGVKLFVESSSAFKMNSRYDDVDNFDSDDEEAEELKDEAEEKMEKKPLAWAGLPLGVHETVFEDKRILLLYQEIGEPQSCGYRPPTAPRTMVLFVEGRNNFNALKAFAENLLKASAQKPEKQKFHLFRWQHCGNYWKRISSEKARPMNSVILPTGFRESVELDMKRFLSKTTRQWYDRRGIPYKRCYMFWGVPGTGKTSLITALAGRFRRNVCFLSAHHPKFTDEALKSALSRVPSRAIIVLEDIDSLFDKDRKTNNNMNPLTFTGLLNAVDGIGEHRGTIFIMTTNFIDRLDSALIRAGRVDMKVEFKHADDYQLSEYFKWFYDDKPEEGQKWAPEWVKAVRAQFPDGVTMAELQQHFVDNMYADAETCVNNLKFYDLPLLQRQSAAEEEKRKKDEEAKKKAKEAGKKDAKKSEKKDAKGSEKKDAKKPADDDSKANDDDEDDNES